MGSNEEIRYPIVASSRRAIREQSSSSTAAFETGMQLIVPPVDSGFGQVDTMGHQSRIDDHTQSKFLTVSKKMMDFINFLDFRAKGSWEKNKNPEKTEVNVNLDQSEVDDHGDVPKGAAPFRKEGIEKGMVVDVPKSFLFHTEKSCSEKITTFKRFWFLNRKKHSTTPSILDKCNIHEKYTTNLSKRVMKNNSEPYSKCRSSKLNKRSRDLSQLLSLTNEAAITHGTVENIIKKNYDFPHKHYERFHSPNRLGHMRKNKPSHYRQETHENQETFHPANVMSVPLAAARTMTSEEALQSLIKRLSEGGCKKKNKDQPKCTLKWRKPNATSVTSFQGDEILKKGTRYTTLRSSSDFQLAVIIAKILDASKEKQNSANVTKNSVSTYIMPKSTMDGGPVSKCSTATTSHQSTEYRNCTKKSCTTSESNSISSANWSEPKIIETCSNGHRVETPSTTSSLLNIEKNSIFPIGNLLKEIIRHVSVALDAVTTSKEFLQLLSCETDSLQSTTGEMAPNSVSAICASPSTTYETSKMTTCNIVKTSADILIQTNNSPQEVHVSPTEPSSSKADDKSSAAVCSNFTDTTITTESKQNCMEEDDFDYYLDNYKETQYGPKNATTLPKGTSVSPALNQITDACNEKQKTKWKTIKDSCYKPNQCSINKGMHQATYSTTIKWPINMTFYTTIGNTLLKKNDLLKQIENKKLSKYIHMKDHRRTHGTKQQRIHKPMNGSMNNFKSIFYSKLQSQDKKNNTDQRAEKNIKLTKGENLINEMMCKFTGNNDMVEYLKKQMNPASYEAKLLMKELKKYHVSLKNPSVTKIWRFFEVPTACYKKSALLLPRVPLGEELAGLIPVRHKSSREEYSSNSIEETKSSQLGSKKKINNKQNPYENSYFPKYFNVIPYRPVTLSQASANNRLGVQRQLPLSKIFTIYRTDKNKLQDLMKKMVQHNKLTDLHSMFKDSYHTTLGLKSLPRLSLVVNTQPQVTYGQPAISITVPANNRTVLRSRSDPRNQYKPLGWLVGNIGWDRLAEAIAKHYIHSTKSKPKTVNAVHHMVGRPSERLR